VTTAGEDNILYRGRLLYPERGPSRFAERLAAAAEAGPARLYLVPSPGLGYGLAALLAAADEDSSILCVEEDPVLAAFTFPRLKAEFEGNRRLAFVEGLDQGRLLAAARELGGFRRVVLVKLSGGAAFHEAVYARAALLLDEEFRAHWRNRASLLAMGRLWTRNIFRNLAAFDENLFLPLPRSGKPVVVCGAGPSLETCLALLSSLRERIFIVAADTAIGTLIAAGVVPDLVVCLEAQVYNLRDFIPLEGRPVALLADLSSHPATFRAASGTKHLSIVTIDEGAFMRRLASSALPALVCPPLGSVGVQAVHIARRIAEDAVFATGLDFSFIAGKSHARGTPALLAEELAEGRLGRRRSQPGLAYRPGVRRTETGELTDPVLSGYAALLAEEITRPGPVFYDMRGRGLPLGARRLGLEEAERALRALPMPSGAPDATGAASAEKFDAVGFLEGEVERLADLETALKGRSGKESREGLAAAILDSDYLLWSLPDRERLAALPQDLLNRVLVETEYWIWRLEEILATAMPSR
jgi:hypothetical protein